MVSYGVPLCRRGIYSLSCTPKKDYIADFTFSFFFENRVQFIAFGREQIAKGVKSPAMNEEEKDGEQPTPTPTPTE